MIAPQVEHWELKGYTKICKNSTILKTWNFLEAYYYNLNQRIISWNALFHFIVEMPDRAGMSRCMSPIYQIQKKAGSGDMDK